MTQRDMAGYIGVTPVTLRNWRREKPKLYEIVMKGFAFEEAVKKAQENADELKALEEKFKIKVVVGTHPIPQNYYITHHNLSTWQTDDWEELIRPTLNDECLRKKYD